MACDAEFEALVETITERVRQRLSVPGDRAAPSPTGVASDPVVCAEPPEATACDGCRGCHVKRPGEVRDLMRLGAARVAAGVGHEAPAADLAAIIDHTLLKPDATRDELKRLCEEARRYGFATVCVNAANVRFCAAQLEGSSVRPIAVVGFPLGASTPAAKAFEAREAIRNGAAEIDMVLNVGALRSKDYALVLDDMLAVTRAADPKPVKVILEVGLLDEHQKVIACALAKIAGAAFVKTATGFGPGGATTADIRLMRAVVGESMGVKASGGVRTEADARAMVEAGATRIGASASVAIVTRAGLEPPSKRPRTAGSQAALPRPIRRAGGY